jgi:endonuclease YncB( thermonuclease family)
MGTVNVARNTLAKTDDLETTIAKLEGQRDAHEKWGYREKARAVNLSLAMLKILKKADDAYREKHGDPITDMGTVERALDGDTLQIRRLSGDLTRVRLYGIDAPEINQPFGPPARDFIAHWEGRLVGWDPVRSDPWGRIIGIVFLGEPDRKSINEKLLEAGLAWVAEYCQRIMCSRWRKIEAEARADRRGLWAQESPLSPWDYRGGADDE